MSDMPAPIEAVPEQQIQEGNEYGVGGPGESFGEAVDAFNDLDGQRPGSEGMESEDPNSDVFDVGEEGESSFMEGEGESEFGDELGIGEYEESGDELGVSSTGPELDYSMEREVEPPSLTENNPDFSLGDVSDEGVGLPDTEIPVIEGPEAHDQNASQEDDELGKDLAGDENKSSPDKQNVKDKKENKNKNKFESKPKPIPGDNILSRLARGEPTEEDLEKLEKDKKRQNSASAVPKGDWLSKGGGGSPHAQPNEDGPSKLEAFQRELKAKQNKWDEIQSWNQRMIQRAKEQQDAMWEGVRKVGKG